MLPGETRNWAPADAACLAWPGSTMVPAPRKISGTSPAIRSMASSATGVRKRQLDDRQTAGHQRTGDRDGVVEVVDHDDGNDGDTVEQ